MSSNNFHWYTRQPKLLQKEIELMNKYYPSFQLYQLESDGRYYWLGDVNPLGAKGETYTIQLIYDHNHPNNNSYGGSIKVYVVDPDLETITRNLTTLPHVLRDSAGHLFLCTARPEDVKHISAAMAVGNAVKWLFVFENWLENIVSTAEFAGHVF